MTIRTTEYMYHASKYVLIRNFKKCLKHISLIVIEFGLVILLSKLLPTMASVSYVSWIIYAVMIFSLAATVVLIINYFAFKNEFRELIKTLKRTFFKRGGKCINIK